MPAPAPRVAALPPVKDDPAQLLGLDRDGVSALLGTPDLIRREAPAEIWQYVGGNCVFDVVLYERGASYAVSYLEARDATAGVQPAQSRSEEHTSELQSLMRISYAVFCLQKKNNTTII